MKLTGQLVSDAVGAEKDPLEKRWWVKLLPRRIRKWLLKRFRDAPPSVRRGYGVWLAVGAVFAVPEIWAAAAKPPWPTLSGTVGHLEELWDFVAVIVVAVLVGVAVQAVKLPFRADKTERPDADETGETDAKVTVEQADEAILGRTPDGRLTAHPEVRRELSPIVLLYAPAALCIGAGFLAASLTEDKWILGYVIYGLILVFFVALPSLLAYYSTPNAPFAGLFPTIVDLQRRLHRTGVVILAGLVVLLIHLAFYPWPDVFRRNPSIDSP
jgi:hypothetical protein